MINYCLALFCLLLAAYIPIAAQENSATISHLEQLFEQLAEHQDREVDYSEWLEYMVYYRSHPLNLNSVQSEELKQLLILNDFQIAVIQDYRKQKRSIQSVYELNYLPGFRAVDVERLAEFVTCEEALPVAPGIKEMLQQGRHQFLLRQQMVWEEQEGYLAVADSILEENPNKNRYLGSPQKLYGRYTFDAYKKLQASVIMEKDAGEEFFQGSNTSGFDFYSASVGYRRQNSVFRQLVIGDYHLRAGQGLLLWSSYAFGKSSNLSTLNRNAELLRVNRSVEENRFLRGAAVSLGWRQFTLTPYVSYKSVDASLCDSNANYFTSRPLTGYHASPSEVERENALNEKVAGAVLQYGSAAFQGGVQILHQQYNKEELARGALYQTFYPVGENQTGASAFYRYLMGRFQVFGETAWSNESWATLNGALFFLHQDLSLGILHRNYQAQYYSFWSNAFAENGTAMNEEGLYLGVEGRMAQHRLKIFADVFLFPWLRYRVNAPSEGYELKGEWEFTSDRLQLASRYRHELKPQNYSAEDNLYRLENIRKESLQFLIGIPITPSIALRERIMLSKTSYGSDSIRHGFLVAQDIKLKPADGNLSFTTRIAWFHAPDYNNRFYLYENDVLYAGGVQMYYRKGWRVMGLIRWDVSSALSLWMKVGCSYYPDEKVLGSGLNTITGNHRTESKLQIRYAF